MFNEKIKVVILITASLLTVLILWFISWALINTYITSVERGIFGDQFGAINSLFSGLAFAGLIITIYLQSKELKSQREELSLTRSEIKGQKQQLELQNESMARQNYENTFFKLISIFQNTISELTDDHFVDQGETYIAKSENEITFVILNDGKCNESLKENCNDIETVAQNINSVYENLYIKKYYNLRQYYVNLNNLLLFLDQNGSDYDMRTYVNSLQSLLTNSQKMLIYYFAISQLSDSLKGLSNQKNTFIELVDKYHILVDLKDSFLGSVLFSNYFPLTYSAYTKD